MPPLNFYDYPGYAEAVERETTLRVEGFVRTEQKLCGLKVKPMTLRHLILLDGCDSPFVTGEECQAVHIPQFFWIVSKHYRPLTGPILCNVWTRIRRRQVIRATRKLKVKPTLDSIKKYVEDSFWDATLGGSSGKAPWASWIAMITHQLGKTYGVAPSGQQLNQMLDLPLVVVWQLLRCIQKDANPDAFIDNKSSMIVHERLAKENGEEWPSAKT